MYIPTNDEFLKAIFGEDAPWAHVTCFNYDPSNIPQGKSLFAWKGDYYSRYNMLPNTNQYFTISTFYCDQQGVARRRKALYRQTHCLVLDDVKEKLSEEAAKRLPTPSWILESSEGSEQWGYIFNEPVTNASMIDNLNDGLIASDLAPSGKDPGQRGVTRYVRLPEGINNKASKLVNGQPFKCRITHWEPFNRVTIEELAQPFHVNLHAARRDARVDGAADVSDHPILELHDIIHIKDVRSDGRFDITCPWVDEHTGADDSGSAVFTNADNTIGFKCHHGACQHRTGNDLLKLIEQQSPGFGAEFNAWKFKKAFSSIMVSDTDFMGEPAKPEPVQPVVDFMGEPTPPMVPTITAPTVSTDTPIKEALNQLRSHPPVTVEARTMAGEFLKLVDELPTMEKVHWHTEVRDIMRWSKPEFNEILKDLRSTWYEASGDIDFFDDVIYIGELNQFYDRQKGIFYTAEAYQNVYSHLDPEARKEALQGGRVVKVDRIDYAPKKQPVFVEAGITYGNTWCERDEVKGVKGDPSFWLDHFDVLGWGEYKKHIVQWMAHTIRHPDIKINHMLLLGSGEGSGKDFLLTPLVRAMEGHQRTIEGEELLSSFNDYLVSVKYLHINETELGDRREAIAISNKLKPLATAPPDKLRVNPKGVKSIDIRNIVNCTMTTNSQQPIRLNGPSRRFLALWTDVVVRDADGEMTDEWRNYWNHRWDWMKNQGGMDAVIYYLRNEVDLSDFNPYTAPPVTEFLREIHESSKSLAEQTIESFIREKVGCFKSDLITANEICTTLRAGSIVAPHLMYADENAFKSPVSIGRLLKQLPYCKQIRARNSVNNMRMWAVRNAEKYATLGPVDVYNEYERQIAEARKVATAPMTMVK